MNRLLLLLSLFLSSFSALAADTAPEFALPGPDGKAVTLSDLRGQVVYVDFWASWCGPCRQSFPWMNKLQAAYGNRGLKVVAINLDQERALADRFIAATRPQFTIAFDPKGGTAESYEVQGMPSSYLIDRSGKIHARHLGFRAENSDKVEAEVRALLEGAQ